jgi:uncharacterized alkaline shock family protein YloU
MNLVVQGELGTVTVPEGVLVAIASRAAGSVEGLKLRRRRSVDVEARTVRLAVSARRGEPLVELAERAQEAVASALEAMCGLTATVDIDVSELE